MGREVLVSSIMEENECQETRVNRRLMHGIQFQSPLYPFLFDLPEQSIWSTLY
jgi:hypothetical protein